MPEIGASDLLVRVKAMSVNLVDNPKVRMRRLGTNAAPIASRANRPDQGLSDHGYNTKSWQRHANLL